jgi:hypothetical protein
LARVISGIWVACHQRSHLFLARPFVFNIHHWDFVVCKSYFDDCLFAMDHTCFSLEKREAKAGLTPENGADEMKEKG